MIALLVMTDGRRDVIERTIKSARDHLRGTITERWVHDDSGDPDYAAWLAATFPDFTIHSTGHRSGFGGAIRSAWAMIRARSDARYVFHLEDDFVFERDVILRDMCAVLDHHPDVVQLALLRQPWNPDEVAAGGIIEQHPFDYVDRFDWCPAESVRGPDPLFNRWIEHRRFFTTNPSLYRRILLEEHDWPTGPHSEGRFGIDLIHANPDAVFAFWGARTDGPWVEHIGAVRVGTGY